MFIFTILWMILGLVVCIINIIFTWKLIKDLSGSDIMNTSKYSSRLKWYPISQIATYLPMLINSLALYILGENVLILYVFKVVFFSIRGLIYVIVFGFTNNIRENVIDNIKDMVGKKEDNTEMKYHLDRLDTLSEYNEDGITNQSVNNNKPFDVNSKN